MFRIIWLGVFGFSFFMAFIGALFDIDPDGKGFVAGFFRFWYALTAIMGIPTFIYWVLTRRTVQKAMDRKFKDMLD